MTSRIAALVFASALSLGAASVHARGPGGVPEELPRGGFLRGVFARLTGQPLRPGERLLREVRGASSTEAARVAARVFVQHGGRANLAGTSLYDLGKVVHEMRRLGAGATASGLVLAFQRFWTPRIGVGELRTLIGMTPAGTNRAQDLLITRFYDANFFGRSQAAALRASLESQEDGFFGFIGDLSGPVREVQFARYGAAFGESANFARQVYRSWKAEKAAEAAQKAAEEAEAEARSARLHAFMNSPGIGHHHHLHDD
ncbi:MAG: hypothetical protein IT371_00250 [Deltaproteobacteria bacterium]|nr:hypothetical protein [Deltaproteobacteria bacterium]